MRKTKISEAIAGGRILVSDGAWGTFLHEKGLKPGECPESWCLERPKDVLDIARSYLDAGADMIESDSFGGSSFKLAHYGLEARAADLNRAAASISRKAAGDGAWVIASIGPTGRMIAMGDVTEEEFYEAFKVQAGALAEGGADAICIETMSDITEAVQAVKAAKDATRCEIICTFTFEKTLQGDYRTRMGVTPEAAARAALEAGADIIGANCGNGMARMVEVVARIRAEAPGVPILVHANAGLPTNVDGVTVFPESPAEMAAFVPALVKAGADIIGGCCGTTRWTRSDLSLDRAAEATRPRSPNSLLDSCFPDDLQREVDPAEWRGKLGSLHPVDHARAQLPRYFHALFPGRLRRFGLGHPRHYRIGNHDAGHLVVHELGVAKARQRPDAHDDGDPEVVLREIFQEVFHRFRVEDRLGDGPLGARFDLFPESLHLECEIAVDGVHAYSDGEGCRIADGSSSDIDAAVQATDHPGQAYGVDVEDAGRVGVVAELGRVARYEEKVPQAYGVGAEHVRLHADQVAVAAGVVQDRLDADPLFYHDRGDDGAHPRAGPA
jgi:5-methyltetrahydrofolate--homocysteine methyltransferase